MRKVKNPLNTKRVLPRMSWHPQNLFNLYQRTLGPDSKQINFTKSSKSVYWQRWKSKAITRAYHGDWIQEIKFKRHYLPVSLLPLAKLKSKSSYPLSSSSSWPSRFNSNKTKGSERVPLSGLMFQEVERRLDVVVFRSCFADSIYEARRMVIHGAVKLNGVKCNAAWTRLHPGDLVTVNPKSIPMLNPGKTWPSGLGDPYVVGKKKRSTKSSKVNEKESNEDDQSSSVEESTTKATETETDTKLTTTETKTSSASSSIPTEKDESSAIPEADEDDPLAKTEGTTPDKSPATIEKSDLKPFEDKDHGNLTFTLPPYSSPFIFIPPYLEVSFRLCSTIFLRPPTSGPNYCEIPSPYDSDGELMRLSWEWYTKQGLGRRIRKLRKEYDSLREMKIDPFSELHLRKNSVGGRVSVDGGYQGGKIGEARLGSAEPRLCPLSS